MHLLKIEGKEWIQQRYPVGSHLCFIYNIKLANFYIKVEERRSQRERKEGQK